MTITYCRNDPVSGRWIGVNRLLTEFEVDFNFYQHETRIATLEGEFSTTVSISYITLHGDQLTFHMTDHTTRGPFTIPIATFRDRGTWQPSTPYSVNDTFDENGTLYLVIFDHVSQLTFSPTANDGLGHDYYSSLLTIPGNALPTGGADGMVLTKTDGHNYDVTWEYPVPIGGASHAILRKNSSSDLDMFWDSSHADLVSAPPASPGGAPGQVLATVDGTSTNTEWIASAGSLASDSDVSITSPQQYDLLEYNGTAWANVQRGQVNLGSVSGSQSIDPLNGSIYTITPTGAVTITQASGAPAGMRVTLKIVTSGTTSYDVTFGSNFKTSGDIFTGIVANKVFTVDFVMDFSGTLCEVGRSLPFPSGATTLGTSGTVSLDPTIADVYAITPTGGVTLNATSAPIGKRITIVYTTSGSSSFTTTFGTNFKTTGTLATGTVGGKVITISFMGDGVNMNETSRTVAM
jgi:hypothetical protein